MKYLNTNETSLLFQKSRNSEIYIDKSGLIEKVSAKIGTNTQYICITRPRRFGKSMNAHMLGAYYTKGQDSKRLFDDLTIAGTDNYEKHLNAHNVIFIDLSRLPFECNSYREYIVSIYNNIKQDLIEAYPFLGEREYNNLSEMFRESGDTFLFILDEWDSVFYKRFMSEDDKFSYLGFLKSLLKDQPYVELAYMTGVLPIAKYSSGSELNMFREYNFMNDHTFDLFFGINEDEVRELCKKHKSVSYEELLRWYDGYYLSDGRHLFNPRSVNCALSDGVCLNYWTETGPMNEIADCIENNVEEVREDIVKMVAGIPVEVDLQGYSAVELNLDTRDEILSAMVVYGFLSYHEGLLRIPNHELMEKFQRVLSRESMGEIKQIVDKSKQMLEATVALDSDKVAAVLEEVHDREIPFLQYNDENALSCVITLCYLYARRDYYIEREEKSGKGYCDYIFLPKKSGKPAIVLELKVNDTCDNALKQIKEKDYLQKAREHAKEILLVAISYDKDKKKHACVIETYEAK
ncbi:MAG: AAA family ATPase [Lachnospiraceae bacterium]|nr:AAA family ATPase [Lachnospiraceae bacterium]